MNLFNKLIDRWNHVEVKDRTPVNGESLKVYCFDKEFICPECTKKYGSYKGCPEGLREEATCGWCNKKEICIPSIFAGWPNIKEPEIKTPAFKAGSFTIK